MNKINVLKSNIEQAKYLAEESILLYNDNSPLRLCLLGFPPIGTVIDTILTSKGQKICYNRLLSFFHNLENEIKEIDERLINLEFIESEEFYDLLVKSIEFSIKTRHDEKRKLYARIIKNRSIVEEVELNHEYYLYIINDLSIEELLVAKKIYELKTTDEYQKLIEVQKSKTDRSVQDKDILALTDLEFEKDDYTFILLRLEKAGLIKEKTEWFLGWEGGVYDITKIFEKLMKQI